MKFEITNKELCLLIGLPEGTVVCITDKQEVTEVGRGNLNQHNNAWIKVPEDWKAWCCPDSSIRNSDEIEVQYRDGATHSGRADDWTNFWSQEGDMFEIVKYRKIS